MKKNYTLAGPRFLLVEDHPFQLIALEMQLNSLGFFNLMTAMSVASALSLINEGRNFDVILCDQHLPDGNGVELITQAYRLGRVTYAIIISAIENQQILDLLLQSSLKKGLPMLGCLSKPFSPSSFMITISPLLEKMSDRYIPRC